MQVMIGLYTAPPSSNGALILDATPYLGDEASFSTNEHGFEALDCSLRQRLAKAVRTYQLGAIYVGAFAGGTVFWEGRLEDPALFASEDGSGNSLGALGSWHALTDLPYTALWSTTKVDEWEPILDTDIASRSPKMYEMDTDNRLFIGLKKNAVYGNNVNIGSLTLETPGASSRDLIGVMFAITIALPNNWNFEARALDRAFGSAASLGILTGTGATLNRAYFFTFTAKPRLEIAVYNNTGANFTFAGEDGTNYARLTGLRVVSATANKVDTTMTVARAAGASVTATVGSTAQMYAGMQLVINSGGNPSEIVTVQSVTSATQFVATFVGGYVIGNAVQGFVVYADEIAKDLVTTVSGLNPGQLSANAALIQSPALDLTDETYEDELPADILTYLAALGDNQTPPRRWEAMVWEGRALVFRPQNSAGRTWYVDVSDLEVERSLEDMANSAYATYQDANNRTLRIASVADSTSIARSGLTRRAQISAQTSSSTQAGIQRDAFLQDHKDPFPRARISFTRIYDAAGCRAPLGFVRAGDTIVIRNLPSFAAVALDRIRTFRITHTEYKPATRELSIEPERPIPQLETLLARLAIGVAPTALPLDKNA